RRSGTRRVPGSASERPRSRGRWRAFGGRRGRGTRRWRARPRRGSLQRRRCSSPRPRSRRAPTPEGPRGREARGPVRGLRRKEGVFELGASTWRAAMMPHAGRFTYLPPTQGGPSRLDCGRVDASLQKYLSGHESPETRLAVDLLRREKAWRQVLVVPAHDEDADFIEGFADACAAAKGHTLVIVVLNGRASDPADLRARDLATLRTLS